MKFASDDGCDPEADDCSAAVLLKIANCTWNVVMEDKKCEGAMGPKDPKDSDDKDDKNMMGMATCYAWGELNNFGGCDLSGVGDDAMDTALECLYKAYEQAEGKSCIAPKDDDSKDSKDPKDSKDSKDSKDGDEKKPTKGPKKFLKGPKGPKKRVKVPLKFKEKLNDEKKKAAEESQKAAVLASLPNKGKGFDVTVTITEENETAPLRRARRRLQEEHRIRRRLEDEDGNYIYVVTVDIFKSDSEDGDDADLEAVVSNDVTEAMKAALEQTLSQEAGLQFEVDVQGIEVTSVEAETMEVEESEDPSAASAITTSLALVVGVLAAARML